MREKILRDLENIDMSQWSNVSRFLGKIHAQTVFSLKHNDINALRQICTAIEMFLSINRSKVYVGDNLSIVWYKRLVAELNRILKTCRAKLG